MKIKLASKNDQRGNVLILTMLLFVSVSLSIGMGMVMPVIKGYNMASNQLHSKQSFYASDSGVEDVLYRLKNSRNVSTTETLVLGEEVVNTTITDVSPGKKIITSVGNSNNRYRSVATTIDQGEGLSFNYGVQVGRGGISLSGSSGIEGNVYANGSIKGCSSCYITGSAVAADTGVISADQINGSDQNPSSELIFGKTSTTEDIAQSFIVSSTTPINKVQFLLKKVGNPSNINVYITTDNNNAPLNSYLSQATLSASLVTGNYSWIDAVFSDNIPLTIGQKYWIVLNASTSKNNYYSSGANISGYADGNALTGKYGGTWKATSPTNLDLYFKVFLGGIISKIEGDSQWNQLKIGTSGSGYAKASNVNYVNVTGPLYCDSGVGNNKNCDTTGGSASPQPWPVSDGNIEDWKNQAISGGVVTGNLNIGNGYQTESLGPKKIVGNVTVSGSSTLNVTGTLWITGDLTISGSAKMKLSSNYFSSSGIVIVDGNVTVSGSSPVMGSGAPGSYILLVSLSDCPYGDGCNGKNAVDVSGAAGAIVLIAQNGTINFSGSASAKQATAYSLKLSGSTSVKYESGLADMSFNSGPAGSWTVSSWKETE